MDEPESKPQDFGAWPLVILFAVVPVLVAAGLLQLIGPFEHPLSTTELEKFRDTASSQSYLPGQLTYIAVTIVHIFACLGAILVAWTMLRGTPGWKQSALVASGMAAGVALAMLLLPEGPGKDISAFKLTYHSIASFYAGVAAGVPFLRSRFVTLSAFDLAIYIPAALGVFAVALMAAAATGQLRLLSRWPADSKIDMEGRLCVVHGRIKRCLYVLAIVLVTSTVGGSLFFHLPTKIPLAALDPPKVPVAESALLRARIADFAAELSIFWGAVYTLTLVAAVGLPLLLAQRKLQAYLEDLEPPDKAEAVRKRMIDAGIAGQAREQFKLLLAMLAPLASGPVANFLQNAANG